MKLTTSLLFFLLTSSLIAFASADFQSDCLDPQNYYRNYYGVGPLSWADDLAASAQDWADNLASTNQFRHSGTPGVGENLAKGTSAPDNTIPFINLWGQEDQLFIPGCTFPDCSKDGSWENVGHFTQMIWRATQEVGCGRASGSGSDVLVCHYRTPGNVLTEKVY